MNESDHMHSFEQNIKRIITLVAILPVAHCTLLKCQAATAPTITLTPGSDIQAAVNSNPAGSTFLLLAGTYRMQRIEPKDGDTFTGQGTVILNGSQILAFSKDSAGSGNWVANATANTWFYGTCQSAYPLCGYAQDLFIDNVLQKPAIVLTKLSAGSWYFDRSHNRVYIPVDPTGHTIELGMQQEAFSGSANNVHISHLIVEKYAAPMQFGAVGGQHPGTGWIISNVESRWNHGVGIRVSSSSQILNSYVHHNGELGVLGLGDNILLGTDELAWNNYAGFLTDNEAGGGKFLQTTHLTLRSNYVHDNSGMGIWTDTNCIYTLIEDNTIVNNLNGGIQIEAGYNTVIRDNIISGNGGTDTTWLWNAAILLQSSSSQEVYSNTVEVPKNGGNGVVLINESRGSGKYGPHIAAHDVIYDNTITYDSSSGFSGLDDNTGADRTLAVSNSFNSNHYILKSGDETSRHWTWFGSENWAQFRAKGQEAKGTCCK